MGARTKADCWGILWSSNNVYDGRTEFLIYNRERQRVGPVLFDTRREARAERDRIYGYIRGRDDLKKHPHGWRLPRVVRVHATYEAV